MPLTDLFRLEKTHWIDDSYLVEALFPDYIDQSHTRELSFRSRMYDPDFYCAINHDGDIVTEAILVE